MFCPKCKAEFVEGVKVCPDCETDLLDKLPEKKETDQMDFIEVLTTFNPTDIALIRSVLDSENLDYFIQGEHFLGIRPLIDPARIMVIEDQAERAKEILHDLELNYLGVNISNK